jgi:hypothetical protein
MKSAAATLPEVSCPAKAGHPVAASARFLSTGQWLLGRPLEFTIGPAEGRTLWRTMTTESHHAVTMVRKQ